ncbi:MAG: hypothetical protein EOP06_01510 [Proteobacteria bacterium]|nr:MAG: hypothetical protein EOP06_01510 [Pseudomonadota bacterium]
MEEQSGGNERSFLVGALLLLTATLLTRYHDSVLDFIVRARLIIAGTTAVALSIVGNMLWARTSSGRKEKANLNSILTASAGEDAVFAGVSSHGDRVDIKHAYRTMHTQVIGTTNAGKTESVIIPWAVDDMNKGRGLIVIDGKSDRSLLDKLYGYARLAGREKDLRILSLCDVSISHSFNPLGGGSPLEITERIFKALTFENEFYKDLQYEATLFTLLIFERCNIPATPQRVIDFLRSPRLIKQLAQDSKSDSYLDWASEFLKMTREEREQRTAGLVSKLQVFAVGETAQIFNLPDSDIDLEKALAANHIIYCQLPVLKIPTLGKAVGKLILQSLQGAISSRHLSGQTDTKYFSVYLDDFTEYLTEGFVSTLNKSRSAKVMITFAHQALGDLATLGEEIQNTILTNANLKVFMRTNEPTSAEYFSSVIGTTQTSKVTERQTAGFFGAERTGEGSVRTAEEFITHPNVFKQELGVGEAVIVVPHSRGSVSVRLQFNKLDDLGPQEIPPIRKELAVGLRKLFEVPDERMDPNIESSVTRKIKTKQKEAQ